MHAPDVPEDEESFVLAAPGVSIEAFLRDAKLREPITDPTRYGLQICSRCRSRPMAFFCLRRRAAAYSFSLRVLNVWAATMRGRPLLKRA